jgi:hypothetical protein
MTSIIYFIFLNEVTQDSAYFIDKAEGTRQTKPTKKNSRKKNKNTLKGYSRATKSPKSSFAPAALPQSKLTHPL